MNLINLIVGDWSYDGHGKIEQYTIQTNKSYTDIIKAHDNGCKKIGFSLEEDVCSEYEDRELRESEYNKIKEYLPNFNLNDLDDGCYMDTKTYTKLYLEIAKLGDSDLKYKIVDMDTINIGGYGLFD